MLVTLGANLLCSFGVSPSTLMVIPQAKTIAEGRPVGSIGDMVPLLNVQPFGMCTSLSNPTVAAATSAAFGVLTPMPCVPAVVGTWRPGSPTVLVGGKPALTNSCTCNCAYGGVITIASPGQFSAQAA
jgi:hypothetical protein